MDNRDTGLVIFSTFTLSILTNGCHTGKDPNGVTQQPNVIFVFADQWRAQATGFAGDPNAHTPAIDKLAGESIVFSTAVCTAPVSSPYRASLLTGKYPLTHGVFMNDVSLDSEINSMGKIFKTSGYNTAYIGKWHLDGHGRSAYIPPERRQGFDYWKVLECTHDYNNSLYYSLSDTVPSKWQGYDAYCQTIDAQNYISEHTGGEKPFLLVLSWGPPHNPYNTAPEKFKNVYNDYPIQLRPNVPLKDRETAIKDLKGYYAHIYALDECIDMLISTIDSNGITSNTIFVFTSDHGDQLYSQGMVRKQKPFDESILVPFLLRYPKLQASKSKIIEAPISTPDILPTLLGLCNLEIPQTLEGMDFSIYLKGKRELKDNNALIMSVTPFGEWSRSKGGVEYRGIRTKRYTYVRKLDGPWLLFDNKTDPYQQNNLVGNPEFSRLQAKIEKILKQQT